MTTESYSDLLAPEPVTRISPPARCADALSLLPVLFLCLACLLVSPATAVSALDDAAVASGIEVVHSEIGRFAAEFKDIHFVWLDGRDFMSDMRKLSDALGEGHELMDYEHHADQVEALNSLNFGRIKMMLAYASPSSSLYRVGKDVEHDKSFVIVLTLNTDVLTGDSSSSTRYMYNVEREAFSRIARQSRVDNISYLRSVVRHEIAHAIKAYLFTGHALTHEPLGGEYNSYVSEIWADLFTALMEKRFGTGNMTLVNNLMDARTVNLVTHFDIQHYTSPVIDRGLAADLSRVTNLHDLAQLVHGEYLKMKPSYQDYEVLAIAAYHLRHALQDTPLDDESEFELIDQYELAEPDAGMLAKLKAEAESAMARVFR